jgi:hypothetical protein
LFNELQCDGQFIEKAASRDALAARFPKETGLNGELEEGQQPASHCDH